MKTKILVILIVHVFILYPLFDLHGQDEVEVVKPMKLSGPRLGGTFILPGEMADKLEDEYGVKPIISQFGWQFETRFFTLDNGTSGLVEIVALLGGTEQNVILPSATVLFGIRNASGLEFALGPNLAVTGISMAFALGATIQSEYVNYPINIALVPSDKGLRISLLIGFNIRQQ